MSIIAMASDLSIAKSEISDDMPRSTDGKYK